jgi:hypothetical protein
LGLKFNAHTDVNFKGVCGQKKHFHLFRARLDVLFLLRKAYPIAFRVPEGMKKGIPYPIPPLLKALVTPFPAFEETYVRKGGMRIGVLRGKKGVFKRKIGSEKVFLEENRFCLAFAFLEVDY